MTFTTSTVRNIPVTILDVLQVNATKEQTANWTVKRIVLVLQLGRPDNGGMPDGQYRIQVFGETKQLAGEDINYRGPDSLDFGKKLAELLKFVGDVANDATVSDLQVELLEGHPPTEPYLGRLIALNPSGGYQWSWSNKF